MNVVYGLLSLSSGVMSDEGFDDGGDLCCWARGSREAASNG